jgi:hypothetical protein
VLLITYIGSNTRSSEKGLGASGPKVSNPIANQSIFSENDRFSVTSIKSRTKDILSILIFSFSAIGRKVSKYYTA